MQLCKRLVLHGHLAQCDGLKKIQNCTTKCNLQSTNRQMIKGESSNRLLIARNPKIKFVRDREPQRPQLMNYNFIFKSLLWNESRTENETKGEIMKSKYFARCLFVVWWIYEFVPLQGNFTCSVVSIVHECMTMTHELSLKLSHELNFRSSSLTS